MKKGIALAAALSLLVAAAPAAAKKKQTTGPFAGTTSGGNSITFNVARGGTVTGINTGVFVTCLSAQSSTPKGGLERFTPPEPARVGQTVQSQALQFSPLSGRDSTKTYTITVRKSGKRLTGDLRESFSYFIPDLYYPRTYLCTGTTQFSAKHV
jgi:hypothetical protein